MYSVLRFTAHKADKAPADAAHQMTAAIISRDFAQGVSRSADWKLARLACICHSRYQAVRNIEWVLTRSDIAGIRCGGYSESLVAIETADSIFSTTVRMPHTKPTVRQKRPCCLAFTRAALEHTGSVQSLSPRFRKTSECDPITEIFEQDDLMSKDDQIAGLKVARK